MVQNKRMLRFGISAGVILAFLWTLPLQVSAQQDIRQEIWELKQRIQELEQKVEAGQKERDQMQEESQELQAIKEKFEHISIGGGVTGVLQAADIEDDWESHNPIDGSYSADLEIEIDMDKWGTGFLHLESGNGENVNDEIQALTGVNADAAGMDNDLDVSEALWSFGLLDDRLQLTTGKLDPVTLVDNNLVAKDETTQFMADIFVDQLAMEWPDDYTPGFQVVIAPYELVDLKMAALSADTDWEDLFDHMFFAAEIALHPKFNGLKGNYRLYGWTNDQHHIEWGDVADAQCAGKTELILNDDQENYGFGLSIDQQITSDITLFARYGWQDDDIAAVVEKEGDQYSGSLVCEDGDHVLEPYGAIEQSWSFGGQITGQRWSRPNDVLGLAFGMAMLNDDYEEYMEENNKYVDPDDNAADELHFEAYYSFYLNEYVSISPDFQIIENPRGNEDADTVFIGGLRTQLSF